MNGIEVELEELRRAGSVMLGASDELDGVAVSGLLLGRRGYGGSVLTGAAERFAARFGHAVEGLALEAEDSGEDLRRTAVDYERTDFLVPARLPALDAPAGTSRV